MLWIVMHIAMTVKTGDQPSLPNMDAQICATEVNDTQGGGHQHALTCPFEYMCYRSKRIGSMNNVGLGGTQTGCTGALLVSSTTNCTAGADIGYVLSNLNISKNFSPCNVDQSRPQIGGRCC